ncbi:hypothetical protein [Candidatus Nitrosocosmicus sp. T]
MVTRFNRKKTNRTIRIKTIGKHLNPEMIIRNNKDTCHEFSFRLKDLSIQWLIELKDGNFICHLAFYRDNRLVDFHHLDHNQIEEIYDKCYSKINESAIETFITERINLFDIFKQHIKKNNMLRDFVGNFDRLRVQTFFSSDKKNSVHTIRFLNENELTIINESLLENIPVILFHLISLRLIYKIRLNKINNVISTFKIIILIFRIILYILGFFASSVMVTYSILFDNLIYGALSALLIVSTLITTTFVTKRTRKYMIDKIIKYFNAKDKIS